MGHFCHFAIWTWNGIYQVYVLQNAEGKFYIGLSENPAQRLIQHNSGVSRWTRGRGPWRIVWESESMTLSDARKLENKLKRQKGGGGLYQLIGAERQAHKPACSLFVRGAVLRQPGGVNSRSRRVE